MLSYALAIAVATSSLVLFSTAFLMSDIHRKDDFLWSGVGLLYALVLWYCAQNITGAVLLGQAAATVLIVSFNWQTINLRKAIANPAKAAEIGNFSMVKSINSLLKRNKPQVQPAATPAKPPSTPKITEQEIAIPDTASESEQPVAETPEKIPTTTAGNTLVERESIKNDPAAVKDTNDFDSEPAAKETPTTKDNPVNQTARATQPQNPQLTQPSAVAETEQAKQTKPEIVQNNQINQSPNTLENTETNSALPAEPKVKTEDSFDNQPQAQANPSNLEIKPVSEIIAPKTSESAKTKTSSLDSLEIVEVAEVLEAISEDTSINRESDQSNIIEVTTTEISITSEVRQIERNKNENSEFKDEFKKE